MDETQQNGLIDNELWEIYRVATRLMQVVTAFEKELIEEPQGRDFVILSALQAVNLMNHFGETASDTTALLAKIAKERVESREIPTVDFPLTRFNFN